VCSCPPATSPFSFSGSAYHPDLHSFPTRRSSDLLLQGQRLTSLFQYYILDGIGPLPHQTFETMSLPSYFDPPAALQASASPPHRSEEHTSELQSRFDLVCRLLLEKKKKHTRQQKD